MSPFRRLLPYVLRYRRDFLVGLVCVVITTAIQLLSPWVLRYAIDDLTLVVTRAKLWWYAGLIVALISVLIGLILAFGLLFPAHKGLVGVVEGGNKFDELVQIALVSFPTITSGRGPGIRARLV